MCSYWDTFTDKYRKKKQMRRAVTPCRWELKCKASEVDDVAKKIISCFGKIEGGNAICVEAFYQTLFVIFLMVLILFYR